ncbi:hypothetical protein BKA63DRAFT_515317 [Paraphoma chrysanthemicola]|nr:hypothetical protein BKA63DRAFT_515317 [Paraphoma chrysanthemicola]
MRSRQRLSDDAGFSPDSVHHIRMPRKGSPRVIIRHQSAQPATAGESPVSQNMRLHSNKGNVTRTNAIPNCTTTPSTATQSLQPRRRGRPPKNAKGAGRPRIIAAKQPTLVTKGIVISDELGEGPTHVNSKPRSVSPAASDRSSPGVLRRPAVYLSRSPSPKAPSSDVASEDSSASPSKGAMPQVNGDMDDSGSDDTSTSDSDSSTSDDDADMLDTTTDVSTKATPADVPSSPLQASSKVTLTQTNDDEEESDSDSTPCSSEDDDVDMLDTLADVSTEPAPADVPSSPPHASSESTLQAGNDDEEDRDSDSTSSSSDSDSSTFDDDVNMVDATADVSAEAAPAELPSSPPYFKNAPASTLLAPASSQPTLSQSVRKTPIPVPNKTSSSQSVSTQAAARRRPVRSSGFPTLREQLAEIKKTPSASQKQSHGVGMLDLTKLTAKAKAKNTPLLGIGLEDEDSDDESSSSDSD